MKTKFFYQCDVNNFRASTLYEIRAHLEHLTESDVMQYDGDYVYRVVDGQVDDKFLRRIQIIGINPVRVRFMNMSLRWNNSLELLCK